MLIPPPDRLGKTTDLGDGYAASAQSMGAALNATVRHRHLCCLQSPSIRKVTSWAKLEIGISKTASAACRRYSVHCPDQEPIRHRRTRRFRVAQTLQVERVPLQPAVLCHSTGHVFGRAGTLAPPRGPNPPPSAGRTGPYLAYNIIGFLSCQLPRNVVEYALRQKRHNDEVGSRRRFLPCLSCSEVLLDAGM